MSISYQPTGMITTSTTNPLDEIPIGPQKFPFGTPTVVSSDVKPYLATNYKNENTSKIIQSAQTYTSTNYENITPKYTDEHQVNDAIPTINKEPYPAANYEKVSTSKYITTTQNETYNLDEYQLGATKYETVSPPIMNTSYQTVITYKPIKRTILVPSLTTSYIPVVDNLVETRVINPPIPTPDPYAQRSLSSFPAPQTVPLPAPVRAPFVPLTSQAPKLTPIITPLPIPEDPHYVSNYPIYEADPRRTEFYIKRNQSILNSTNLNPQVISTSYYPTYANSGSVGVTDLGINTGLKTGLYTGINENNTVYNTGLSGVNTEKKPINLSGLNTGLNNLGTDINTIGTTVGNSPNNLKLNNDNYLNSTINNLNSGTNNFGNELKNNLTNTASGIKEGFNNLPNFGNNNTLTDNLSSGLNNFGNKVGDITTSAVNNTKEGINNITSGVKGLFD